MLNPETPIDDPLNALSERVLKISLTVLAVAMPLTSATLLIGAFYRGSLTHTGMIAASTALIFPLLRLTSSRLGFRPSALLIISFLVTTAFFLAARGGLTVGYAALCVLAIQLSALFFRRRGAALGLATILIMHVTAWMLVRLHIGPPLSLDAWDPRGDAVWIRHLVILAMLGLLMAIIEVYVIEQLASSLAMHRDLAAREKAQRVALEEAERQQAREREQRDQAQQALERSRRIEALARVAGGVAHDFNNALTVILGAAEAAREDAGSPAEVEAHMDGIISAARHAAALTNQLLTLGRQHVGTPKPVSMTALLKRIRPAFQRTLPADAVLLVHLPPDDVFVRADETGIERALLNLVLNARDAMPQGGTITIRCQREDRDPPAPGSVPFVVLQVIDDGLGMDQETLERVFDPFFTTKGDKGTGLGLATVYAFATEAGGAVNVESAREYGTTVTMWLPEAAAAATTAFTAVAATEDPKSTGGRILVVEDLDQVRTMMSRLLGARGFDVLEARNGDEAIAILQRGEPIALMCIDGVMPGLSTAATIERARELAPRMAVIVCSGHVQEDLLRRGIETGRYELLQKPFSSQDLVTRISRAIGDAAARR